MLLKNTDETLDMLLKFHKSGRKSVFYNQQKGCLSDQAKWLQKRKIY